MRKRKSGKISTAKSCKECRHSTFNKAWGDYKCLKKQRYVYQPDLEANICDEYEYEQKKFEEVEEDD